MNIEFFSGTLKFRFRKYELITVGYLAATALLAILSFTVVPQWKRVVLTQTGFIFLITLGTLVNEKHPRIIQIVRDWYLLALFPMIFKNLTFISTALLPLYLEPLLIWSDKALYSLYFSFSPFHEPSVFFTELMAFSYWSYYIILPAVGLLIYLKFPKQDFEYYMLKVCAALVFCYILFILVPVRGPHHSMPGVDPLQIEGGFFLWMIRTIQSQGSVVGAAFPSSHIAVAWISIFALRQIDKRLYLSLIHI